MTASTPRLDVRAPGSARDWPETWIVVPVDGSAAVDGALRMALALARHRHATIVLAGVPPLAWPDRLEVNALVQASEMGVMPMVASQPAVPAGGADAREEAASRTLWQVLLPRQRRLSAAGLPVAVKVLAEGRSSAELRELIAGGPAGSTLALTGSETLREPLLGITRELLLSPPCTLWVADLPSRIPSRERRGLVAGLLRKLCRPRAR
jgi:nucleotide-binding universal stress UspA family protein